MKVALMSKCFCLDDPVDSTAYVASRLYYAIDYVYTSTRVLWPMLNYDSVVVFNWDDRERALAQVDRRSVKPPDYRQLLRRRHVTKANG